MPLRRSRPIITTITYLGIDLLRAITILRT